MDSRNITTRTGRVGYAENQNQFERDKNFLIGLSKKNTYTRADIKRLVQLIEKAVDNDKYDKLIEKYKKCLTKKTQNRNETQEIAKYILELNKGYSKKAKIFGFFYYYAEDSLSEQNSRRDIDGEIADVIVDLIISKSNRNTSRRELDRMVRNYSALIDYGFRMIYKDYKKGEDTVIRDYVKEKIRIYDPAQGVFVLGRRNNRPPLKQPERTAEKEPFCVTRRDEQDLEAIRNAFGGTGINPATETPEETEKPGENDSSIPNEKLKEFAEFLELNECKYIEEAKIMLQIPEGMEAMDREDFMQVINSFANKIFKSGRGNTAEEIVNGIEEDFEESINDNPNSKYSAHLKILQANRGLIERYFANSILDFLNKIKEK